MDAFEKGDMLREAKEGRAELSLCNVHMRSIILYSISYETIILFNIMEKAMSVTTKLYSSIDDSKFFFHNTKTNNKFKAQSVVINPSYQSDDSPSKNVDDCPYDSMIINYLKPFTKYIQMARFQNENLIKEINLRRPKYVGIVPTNKVIIFDMDETLVHYSVESDNVYVRPHAIEVLEALSGMYELWLWTASEKEYANVIVNSYIDPKHKYFKHVFTRSECIQVSTSLYIKDLRIFSGLKIEDAVIIENQLLSFCTNLGNGYLIDTYMGSTDDEELLTVLNIMAKIKGEPDLRKPLKDIFHFEECIEYIFTKK